jgi:hypothetical protein
VLADRLHEIARAAGPRRELPELIRSREPGTTSRYLQRVGYLITALRRQGLIADELVLQLAAFLRSLDLFLELMVLTVRTLTANQVRHGSKQGTHQHELSRIHSSAYPALTSLRGASGRRVNYFFNVEIICQLRRTGTAVTWAECPPFIPKATSGNQNADLSPSAGSRQC